MNYVQKLAVGAIKQFKEVTHVDWYEEDGHHRLRRYDEISVFVENGVIEVYPGGLNIPINSIQTAHVSAYGKDELEVSIVVGVDEYKFLGFPR